LTLGTSRKTTFLKRGDKLSPFLAYVLHWLPYFAWRLERTRKQSCAAITNAIMCPETIYLCTYAHHTSCTSCSLAPTNTTDELSTPILFHGTEFQLPGLLSHKLREQATLAHYLNNHSTDLLVSAEGSLDSALPQGTQNIDFALTDADHDDDAKKVIILMTFERDVARQGTMLQQPLLGSKLIACNIAVIGSRSVGTTPLAPILVLAYCALII
jgi:hypothetical protein